MIELPEAFLNRQKKDLGKDYEKYLESMKMPAARGIRVNTKKIQVNDFFKQFSERLSQVEAENGEDKPAQVEAEKEGKLSQAENANNTSKLKKLEFAGDAFRLCSEIKTGNLPESLAGLFYSQEPSSMIPVCASEIDKENRPLRVLDLCASPGGKTGQIACRISDDSILFSNEIISSRAEILYSNVERQGFKNVIILNEKPENFGIFEHFFDYVFVDAPCSGEGMFRKNPETISEWTEQNVEMCAERQKQILSVASKLVAANGKLIYSTCTFSKSEDEEVVEWFLKGFNFRLLDVSDEIKKVTVGAVSERDTKGFSRKCYPMSSVGEGQFVAVFECLDAEKPSKMYAKKHYKWINLAQNGSKKVLESFVKENFEHEFAQKFLSDLNGRLFELKDNLYFVPEGFDQNLQTALDSLHTLSVGVRLGKVQKDRFEPNHAIFLAFGEHFKLKEELTPENLPKYLHGEELRSALDKKGYVCVTAGGYAIGGAKLVDGKLKNLYPKGLRT